MSRTALSFPPLVPALMTVVIAALALGGCPPPPETAPSHGDGNPRPEGEAPAGEPKPGEGPASPSAEGTAGPLPDGETPVPFPQANEPRGKVELMGVVRDLTTGEGVGGAAVTVPGAAEETAATASDEGRFKISINTGERLTLHFAAEGYLSSQMELLEPADAMAGDPYFFPMLPTTFVQQNLSALGQPELEAGKGAVLLDFDRGVATTAKLSTPGRGSMTIESNGTASKGAKLADGERGAILFVNVPAGGTAVTLQSTGDVCKVVNDIFDEFEVNPDTVSAIAVECGGG